jgi:ABC-type cobalamin/Fe3+-siderophores transport system ATPase subunit
VISTRYYYGERAPGSDLRHRFGELVALDGVSFGVGGGEIVGLVGRNGAGKTTTMRSVMGIVRPDRGTVRWSGHDVGQADRLRFGCMPEERGLYPQMRLGAQVAYFASLHGFDLASAGLSLQGLGEYAYGRHTHPPALVVGYAKPPEHAYTAAVARLVAVLREATS